MRLLSRNTTWDSYLNFVRLQVISNILAQGTIFDGRIEGGEAIFDGRDLLKMNNDGEESF
jgi:hypothetical protein